jgi:uncharacterized membrane protein
VFIVVTFGLAARRTDPNGMLVAAASAVAAGVLVLIAAVLVRRPLSSVPENTLKYVVGLLLSAFGTFWSVEGLGVLRPGRESLEWPGADLAIVALVAAWFVLSRILVAVLRRTDPASSPTAPANQPVR